MRNTDLHFFTVSNLRYFLIDLYLIYKIAVEEILRKDIPQLFEENTELLEKQKYYIEHNAEDTFKVHKTLTGQKNPNIHEYNPVIIDTETLKNKYVLDDLIALDFESRQMIENS